MADMNPKTAKAGGARPTSAEDDTDSQLDAIRAELARLAEMMSVFAKEQAQHLRASAETVAEEATEKARKARDDLAHGIGQAEKALDHRVQEHPLQSILMAFGFGVLMSLLIRR